MAQRYQCELNLVFQKWQRSTQRNQAQSTHPRGMRKSGIRKWNSDPSGIQKAGNKAGSQMKGPSDAVNRICAFIEEQPCGIMTFNNVIKVYGSEKSSSKVILVGYNYADGNGRKLLQKSRLAMMVSWTGELRVSVGRPWVLSLISSVVWDDRIHSTMWEGGINGVFMGWDRKDSGKNIWSMG